MLRGDFKHYHYQYGRDKFEAWRTMTNAMVPVEPWLQEDPARKLRGQLCAVLKGGLAAFKALDMSRGVYVENNDRNKMNSWFWEQNGKCQFQPRCCLGNCSKWWRSLVKNERWAKYRFPGTHVLQLFRESSTSFQSRKGHLLSKREIRMIRMW